MMSKTQVVPCQSTSPPTLDAHPKAHTGGARSSSPKCSSLSASPSSGTASIGSPSTAPTTTSSSATGSSTTIPTNDEVEAVIKMATSTRPTPDGRPPPGKDTRTQLYSGNLPYRVRWQDLKDLFRRAGTVLRADVSLSPDNRSRGYGTVLMASAEDAGRAVDMFHGFSWQGRILEVRLDRLGAIPGTDMDPTQMVGSAATSGSLQGAVMGFGAGMGVGGGMAQQLGIGMGLGVSAGGLQVPSPHPAFSLAAHNLSVGGSMSMPTSASNVNSGIPSISAGAAATTAGISSRFSSSALAAGGSLNSVPSSPIHASLLAIHQHQQFQRDREREDVLIAQAQAQAQLRVQSALKSSLLGANLGVSPSIGPSPLSNSTTTDSFLSLGLLGRQDGYERDSRPASNLGMRSLFVGNLPFHCQWQDLKDLFRQAGTIVRADVSLGPDGRSRGFGTVSFANEIDAERAVAMFNGYDYNGRTLKVHYDRFCAQSPLPSQNLSTFQHSLNSTPVQPAATSTQATLLQAAQLRQLVNGQSHGGLSDLHSTSHPAFQAFNQASTSATSALAALHEFNSTGQIGLGGSSEQREKSIGSSPVSPYANHFALGSGGLAERRQNKQSQSTNLPAPIGSGSASAASSRPGTSAGAGSTMSSSSAPGPSGIASSAGVERLGGLGRATSLALDEAISPIPSLSKPAHSIQRASDAKLSSDANGASSSSKPQAQPSSSSTSPRTTHPAHPGPISLPPPAPIGPFPLYSPHHAHLQHPMSPTFGHPMSPYGYPGYPLNLGPMSPPVFLPGHMQMHAGHTMTPHGLPPITPSMPSFSFVPQPSPGPISQAGFGSSAIPPTPKEGDGPSGASDEGSSPESGIAQSANYPQQQHQGQGQQGGMQGMPPYAMYGMMSPPMHIPGHVFQPFTPGATMSPGVYFQPAPGGRGGTFISSAIGSPVGHPHHTAYFGHPGSQPVSPYYGPPMWTTTVAPTAAGLPGQQQGQQEGYFPSISPTIQKQEGYFPPVPPTLGTSGLANEILRDGSQVFENSSSETAGASMSGMTDGISALSLGSALSTADAVPSTKQTTGSMSSSPSYAAIASTRPNRSESSSSSGGSTGVLGGVPASTPGARHYSMNASNSVGRPQLTQKTLSDEGKTMTGDTSGLLSSS